MYTDFDNQLRGSTFFQQILAQQQQSNTEALLNLIQATSKHPAMKELLERLVTINEHRKLLAPAYANAATEQLCVAIATALGDAPPYKAT
jgi:hypothetical protein